MSLTDEQFEQYQREGYVVVENVLTADEVERVRRRLDDYVTGEREERQFGRMLEPAAEEDGFEFDRPGDPVRKFEGVGMVREDDVFREVAFHDGVVEAVTQLQGPNLKLLRSAAMLKPPGVGSEKKFHQDAAYYPIRPMDHVTVWIALDEATTENGCMQVVPAAHTDGLLRHEELEYETDIALAGSDYGERDTVALPMGPGDALFQHCLLPHYTAPNESERWRRAFIVAYMRARSRFTTEDPPEWVDSLRVTGEEFPGCV
ncbi:phytanoyl-CoA dioxygenase family protein [Halomarina halobia]|uniref:Phytanoyl-CoA dioxygenase family protein n=1 Tax=Halomarina halobia TaxID=3033386 RepID=A0ABD6AER6_9EURY|nr:phytanoyl-CoA dioxygenase family protein [Halomarina sp. PSR21]